jgi:hypothetical protein
MFCVARLSMRTLPIRARTNPANAAPPSNSPARKSNSRFATELENSFTANDLIIDPMQALASGGWRIQDLARGNTPRRTAVSGFQPPDTLAP